MIQNDQIEQAAKECREVWANTRSKIAWCCHHEVQIEPLAFPVEERIQYILNNKPQQERVIRLTNFRPFEGELPVGMQKAYADWQKAYADWQKADADWQKADADWQKADADCKDELNILHKQQVPCNSWNGKSIF